MRGPRLSYLPDAEKIGIIPAYAGTTYQISENSEVTKDHPRLCGDHRRNLTVGKPVIGSSPPMRGPLDRVMSYDCDVRIIPAYAGTTDRSKNQRNHRGDHPRLCGDHASLICQMPRR